MVTCSGNALSMSHSCFEWMSQIWPASIMSGHAKRILTTHEFDEDASESSV